MKKRILSMFLMLALYLTTAISTLGLEEAVEATDAVDGNTRGIMFLVMILGFGTIAFIGFYISATEGYENREQD